MQPREFLRSTNRTAGRYLDMFKRTEFGTKTGRIFWPRLGAYVFGRAELTAVAQPDAPG